MVTKKIKDIHLGEILAENIYRDTDAEKASRQIPIVVKGTPLTSSIVKKLLKIFGEEYEILVVAENEGSTKAVSGLYEGDEIEIQTKKLNPDNISKEEALELYKKSIFKKEMYTITRDRLLSAFKEINGVLEEFKTTNELHERKLTSVSDNLVNLIQKGGNTFDPSLVYIVELENWDKVTFNHSFDVGVISLAFASSFTEEAEELASLFIAGLVHDIGKFIYSKYNLNEMDYIIKKEGKLTEDEFEQIKKHVDVEDFLKDLFLDFDKRYRENIIFGAVEHHEKFKGNGYIHGKSGMEISFAGRIIAICDVYDALVRERRYKSAMKPNKAMEYLKKLSAEGHFDPILFNKFYKTFGKYPVGSVVNTNRGVGVVVEQTRNHERPIVFYPKFGEIDASKDKNLKILE